MISVRNAGLFDLSGCYRVCLGTGDIGEDASAHYRDPDLLGHVYVGPYLAHPDRIGFVAVDDAGVVGYVLGALHSLQFETWAEQEWWPPLRHSYPAPIGSAPDDDLIHLLHVPYRALADLVERFPSHLHIDLLARAQGRGLGRRLIEMLLDQLHARGSHGVHLVVAPSNARAIGFYERLGFTAEHAEPDGLTMVRALPPAQINVACTNEIR